jgi:PQ loop repeat
MLTTTEIAGFVGAGLAGAAYVPQISHLIRAGCSAGISRLAFEVWLLASLLTTTRAIAIHADVFIVLGGIQIVATTLIMLYAARYKDKPCPSHLPRPPRAKTATRTGSSGNEPGSRRPADPASPQQGGAVHDGSPWADFSAALPAFPRTTGIPRSASGVLPTAWHERMPPSAARTLQFIPSAVHRIQATHLRGTR